MAGAQSLADYLTARYDEAEAAALKAIEGTRFYEGSECRASGEWSVRSGGMVEDLAFGCVVIYEDEPRPGLLDYIALNEPAARLRDMRLKRAILAGHRPDEYDPEYCRTCVQAEPGWASTAPAETPCETVRQLGTEFSRRPDYREEWKPARVIGDVAGKLRE